MGWVCSTLFGILVGVAAAPVAKAQAAPPRELAVAVFDDVGQAAAGLAVTDRVAVDGRQLQAVGPKGVQVRIPCRLHPKPPTTRTLGMASGPDAVRDGLVSRMRPDQDATRSLAAVIVPAGGALWEGMRCGETTVFSADGVVAVASGLPPAEVQSIVRRVGAVAGDPTETLLALAAAIEDYWPGIKGPRSAMLVSVGQEQTGERIAVDLHRRVGRRLVERHLTHLRDVEMVHQLLAADRAFADAEPVAGARALRKAIRIGRRVLAMRPRDAKLHARLAVALATEAAHSYEARRHAELAVSYAREEPEIFRLAAETFYLAGEYGRAAAELERAATLAPDDRGISDFLQLAQAMAQI